MPDKDLKGKVIVITGASSGFGKGAALKFAAAGASIVIAARRDELLQDLARECEERGGHAVVLPTDVSNISDVEQLAQQTIYQFGRIDVWINNAGVGAIGRFEEVPLEDHDQVIETNLLGSLYGSYYAFKQFRQQNFGILINIASVLGKTPSPYYSSYAASKHGVVGLSAALRQELQETDTKDIRVCTVMPTSMDTPFFEHEANYTGHQASPIPPVYEPEKVIDAIFKLATDPEDEVVVGASGKLMTFLHRLMPGATESMMASQTHKAQMEKAPPAPDTRGSVHEPEPEGTEVSGGWKKN
jgi:short-subunit dehydrogenase